LAVKAGFEKPLILAKIDYENLVTDDLLSIGELLVKFSFPADGKVISRYGIRSGKMHTGTDIKMSKGDTIYAAYNGVVTRSNYYYGYGNLVIIQHEKNLETYYSHLSGFLVKSGEKIAKGEPVGMAGATGRATTSHLHFEIRENEVPYDPELIFDFEQRTIKPDRRMLTSLTELDKKPSKNQLSNDKTASQQYVVRSGDSLWNISRKVKTTVEALCQLNDLSETAVLQIGQVLNIY
jgi:murein DD-endopeptidase MepM/ murein hydrolase activator NlpD